MSDEEEEELDERRVGDEGSEYSEPDSEEDSEDAYGRVSEDELEDEDVMAASRQPMQGEEERSSSVHERVVADEAVRHERGARLTDGDGCDDDESSDNEAEDYVDDGRRAQPSSGGTKKASFEKLRAMLRSGKLAPGKRVITVCYQGEELPPAANLKMSGDLTLPRGCKCSECRRVKKVTGASRV